MADIIIRQSDGRVFAAAAHFTQDAGAFIADTGARISKPGIAFTPVLVQGVTLPSDFVPGLSHDYVGGQWQTTGYTPPAEDPWMKKAAMPANVFIATVGEVLGGKYWKDIETSENGAFVAATIAKVENVDPNDSFGNFRKLLAYLKAYPLTGAAGSGTPMMSDAQEALVRARFKDKT
jgi:hypothetical protein